MAYSVVDSNNISINRLTDGDIVQRSSNNQLFTVGFVTIISPDGDYEAEFFPGVVNLFSGENNKMCYSTNLESIPMSKEEKFLYVGAIDRLNDTVVYHLGMKYRISTGNFKAADGSLPICKDGSITTNKKSNDYCYLSRDYFLLPKPD